MIKRNFVLGGASAQGQAFLWEQRTSENFSVKKERKKGVYFAHSVQDIAACQGTIPADTWVWIILLQWRTNNVALRWTALLWSEGKHLWVFLTQQVKHPLEKDQVMVCMLANLNVYPPHPLAQGWIPFPSARMNPKLWDLLVGSRSFFSQSGVSTPCSDRFSCCTYFWEVGRTRLISGKENFELFTNRWKCVIKGHSTSVHIVFLFHFVVIAILTLLGID